MAAKKMTRAQRYMTLAPKTTAVGISAPLTVLLVYSLNAIWGIDAPDEVDLSIGAIIAFVCSYFAPKSPAVLDDAE